MPPYRQKLEHTIEQTSSLPAAHGVSIRAIFGKIVEQMLHPNRVQKQILAVIGFARLSGFVSNMLSSRRYFREKLAENQIITGHRSESGCCHGS